MAKQVNAFDELHTARIVADELVIAEITAPLIVTERVESLTDLELEAGDDLSLVAGDDVLVTPAGSLDVDAGADADIDAVGNAHLGGATADIATTAGNLNLQAGGATSDLTMAADRDVTVSPARHFVAATVDGDATVSASGAGRNASVTSLDGDANIDAQGITSDVNLDAGRSVLVGAGDSFEVTAVNTVSITSPLNTVTGNVLVTGTLGINGQPGAAPTVSGGSIGAFSDPPTPAEMAALRTLVNNLLTANINFGTNT